MARTTINSLGVPAGTIVAADLTYPLTTFSSTGIDDNADATAITIDSSEKVGIGTASPAALLHINGSGDAIRVTSTNSGAGGAQVDLLHFSASPADGDDHASINFGGYYSGSTSAYGSAIRSNWTDVSAREACLKFYTRDDTTFYNHMQLNHFGHLLVGREDNSSHSSRVKIVNGGGSGYEASLDFCYEGKDTVRARINTDASGGAIEFHTFDSDGLQERMRINSAGKVLIGTTSASPAFSSSGSGISLKSSQSNFSVDGAVALILNRNTNTGNIVQFRQATNAVGNIAVTASATAYNTSSDYRLKENIVDAPAGSIDAVRVRSFDWKIDGSHQTYGMVAQELVEVAPEAVSQGETDEDMWSVDYSKLVPMMIKEIQDLRARVAQLEGTN